jgi:hypothetical protein
LGLVAEEADALEIDLLGLVPQTGAEFAINDDEREHVAQMAFVDGRRVEQDTNSLEVPQLAD